MTDSPHNETRKVLMRFVASLTNGGKNRSNLLSINHDDLDAILADATAALATIQQDKGWRRVPAEATRDMTKAAWAAIDGWDLSDAGEGDHYAMAEAWVAMCLAALPAAPQGQSDHTGERE